MRGSHEEHHPSRGDGRSHVLINEKGRDERGGEADDECEPAADLRDAREDHHAHGCAQHVPEVGDGDGPIHLGFHFFGGDDFLEVLLENHLLQIHGVFADGPQADDAGARDECADEEIFPPPWLGEQCGVWGKKSALWKEPLLFQSQPFLGFLEIAAGEYDHQCGCRTDEEHPAPARTGGDGVVRLQRINAHLCKACGDVADGGKDLQQAEGLRARAVGHGLRDERDCEAEHAADTDAGEESENGEVHFGLAEVAQPGEGRINEDGQREHLRAAKFIAERTEDEPADSPADEEASRDHFSKSLQCGIARREFHQLHERGNSGERKKALIEAVKKPRGGCDQEDEPMIAGELFPPRETGVLGHGGAESGGACDVRLGKICDW